MMKKFLFTLIVLFSILHCDAQIVINSRYKGLTYDEMVAPLRLVQQFHSECLNALGSLADQTEQAEQYISKDKDPKTWSMYVDCYNAIINAYDSISENGTNRSTRGVIADLQRQSSSLLGSIRAAYDRRNRLANDQYARLRSVEGLTCDRFFSDMSIDEFMGGNTPTVKYQTREQHNVLNR